ncbi:MAG: InlB B-repeat-containing protein [Bacilli bacterium]|nr:InlB B-repeat-containing protein [Bacilli bacterium]
MVKLFKKAFRMLIVLGCLFMFTSCGDEQVDTPDDKDDNPVVEEKVNVEFYDIDDNLLKKYELKKGESVTEFPVCEEEGYYYSWDKTFEELTNIQNDIKVVGIKLEYYLNAKYYVDGELFFEKNTGYLSEYTIPELPNDYENCVWNETSRTLVEDKYFIEYTLSYTLKSKYTITYMNGNEAVSLSPSTYEVGNVLELPTLEKEGYYFVGWFLSKISLHKCDEITEDMRGDLVFYARFTEIEKQKPLELPEATYNFVAINKNPHGSGNGTFVYQPQFPEGVDTRVTSYEWSTSNSYIATVSAYSSITAKKAGYCVLTAKSIFDKTITINCVIRVGVDGVSIATVEEANTITTYEVTFVGKDNEVIEKQTIQKGGFAIAPIPPKYDGLAFNGWDHELYNINANTTIKATYKTGTNNYAGKKFSLIGDSISTYQDYVPTGYATFYPYPTADVNDVNQTWWMQAFNKIGGSMFINNSYSGSCVAAGGSSCSNNINRLKELVASNQYADVIIIFMGSNDCNDRSGVTTSNFDKQYREMLDKLNDLCPNAELILCTLPNSNLYSDARQVEFNGLITKIAEDYQLKVISLDKVDLTPHLIDSAHPGTSGMTAVAEQVVKDLLK